MFIGREAPQSDRLIPALERLDIAEFRYAIATGNFISSVHKAAESLMHFTAVCYEHGLDKINWDDIEEE